MKPPTKAEIQASEVAWTRARVNSMQEQLNTCAAHINALEQWVAEHKKTSRLHTAILGALVLAVALVVIL